MGEATPAGSGKSYFGSVLFVVTITKTYFLASFQCFCCWLESIDSMQETALVFFLLVLQSLSF